MSQENVEIVSRLMEAFNRQDASGVADLWAPDAEWRPAYFGGGLLEGAVFRGPEGAVEFVQLQAETWESVVAEPVKMRDLGDTILVEVHLSAVGRGSGVRVEQVTWNVFEVVDGRATSGTVYTSKEQALQAIGLED
jgi:ketosteroid isomerase-like protein